MEENLKKRNLWKYVEITEMLSIIKEKHVLKLLDSKIKRNKNILEEVARELGEKGIKKDAVQIRTKFKALKSEYYKIKRNNNTSGAERQSFEYFDLLDEILSHRPALTAEGEDTSNNQNSSEACEYDSSKIGPSKNKENHPKVFRNPKKKSYQKTMETFTKEWKQSQEKLIDAMKEQDTNYLSGIGKLLEENRKETAKMLEEDRRETAHLFSSMFNMMQSPQPMWVSQRPGVLGRSTAACDSFLFSPQVEVVFPPNNEIFSTEDEVEILDNSDIFTSTPRASPTN